MESTKLKEQKKATEPKTLAPTLVDTEQFPTEFISQWLGNAIFSFSKDKFYEDHPERYEAIEMLQCLHARIVPHLKKTQLED